MPDSTEDTSPSSPVAPEDVIGSPPSRMDALMVRVDSRIPHSFGRAAVLTVILVAAAAGFVFARVTAAPPIADPAGITSGPATTGPEPGSTSPAGLRRGLLTLAELAAIGEQASGGTYTRGSASAIPDPCSPPAPGDPGVSYIPGPSGATAVSFQVAGGSVTQRLSTLADDQAAGARLRDVVAGVRICQFGAGTTVVLDEIGPGLGDEFLAATVVRRYPSGSSSTVAVLVIRVGASLVEFSITGPSSAAAGFAERCYTITLAGLND